MSRSNPRSLAYFTVAWTCFAAAGAKAGVGPLGGGALSPAAHLSLVQTVQAGECWQQNGPDGPGYYPCGVGGGGGVIANPPVDPGHRRSGDGAESSALRGVGQPGAQASPGLQKGAPPTSPGLAGVHEPKAAASPGSSVGAGVHAPGTAPGTHMGAVASPGIAGRVASVPHIASPTPLRAGAVHVGGAAPAAHIGVPAAPALAGVHGPGAGIAGHR